MYPTSHNFMKLFSCLHITNFFQGLSCCIDIGTYEVIILQEVQDESDGCGAKFSVLIVSDKFEGKPLLQRHRYKFWLSLKIIGLLMA
jgi:Stress-induced morphogen (activity unknown)